MARKRLYVALALVVLGGAKVPAAPVPDTVAFPSGNQTLHGLLYKPAGPGPFPAVIYNHGSAPGLYNNEAFDAIAPYFVQKGWAFFAPYRRGQGLSADAGPYVMTEINAAIKKGGMAAGDTTLVRLLSGEQLDDQLSALRWLEGQPFVQTSRIAVMGNSFGGIETMLGAEHHPYCAAVNLTGAAMSWDQAPRLRAILTKAARNSQAPTLFIQAENDYSTEPSKVLYAAARGANRVAQIHIYPAFHGAGSGGMQGHSFAWLGVSEWWPEAFGFIAEHCAAEPVQR